MHGIAVTVVAYVLKAAITAIQMRVLYEPIAQFAVRIKHLNGANIGCLR